MDSDKFAEIIALWLLKCSFTLAVQEQVCCCSQILRRNTEGNLQNHCNLVEQSGINVGGFFSAEHHISLW